MVVGDYHSRYCLLFLSCFSAMVFKSLCEEQNLKGSGVLGVIVIIEFFLKFNFNLIRCVSTCLCQDIYIYEVGVHGNHRCWVSLELVLS